jgi:hypothetical protein
MLRTYCTFTLGLAFVVLATSDLQAQQRHPRLHAALHELREAKRSIRDIPGPRDGKKKDLILALDAATDSIKLILDIKDDNFKGIDRSADFYKRYPDHPRLRAAMDSLRDAREELRDARANFGNNRQRAVRDVNYAIDQIQAWIASHRRP